MLTCRSEKRKLVRSNRLPQFPALCDGNWAGEFYTFSAPPARAARDERRATMKRTVRTILQGKLRGDNYGKLVRLQNPKLNELLADAITLCEPESVFVCADSEEEIRFVREQAHRDRRRAPAENPRPHGPLRRPERPGPRPRSDQVPRPEVRLPRQGAQPDRPRGRPRRNPRTAQEQHEGADDDRPPAVPGADRVGLQHPVRAVHRLLLRRAQRRPALPAGVRPVPADARRTGEFFCILHSCGRMDERMVSVDADKKRIYIDYTTDMIYSVNTQYAGNSIGLKKLALRLTIRKADREGWLAEHMFLMGVHGPNGRKTYFSGAFPSACGKTSTAMLPGETILGDDIAYLRNINAEARAVNAERGIFGIVQNVNPADDPAIYRALTNPGEVVFSNVLVADGRPVLARHGLRAAQGGREFHRRLARREDRRAGQPDPAGPQERALRHLAARAGKRRPATGQSLRRGRPRDHVRRPRRARLHAGAAGLRLGARHLRLRRLARDGDHLRHRRQGGRSGNQHHEHPGLRGHPAGQVHREQPGIRPPPEEAAAGLRRELLPARHGTASSSTPSATRPSGSNGWSCACTARPARSARRPG